MKYIKKDFNLKQNCEQEFLNQTFDNYFNHFIRVITNRNINEKLLNCYRNNRQLLSKSHQKWRAEWWDEEELRIDDSLLPPNSKNIVYDGNYLNLILYGQVKLIAYQMNQIILQNFKILYN
ncbi:hypothetical protein [Spiroplasma endosymbiont of Nebria brevicollis]|uniref:hypothetical protein n=1 Tax=Spiroplasma endosymbiont of Nebria brevicollis TaxID=3066284 RepID=UPI00313C1C4B